MIMQSISKYLRRSQGHTKGFTLLELLIVIGIVAVIGTVVYTVFTNITKKSSAERTASQVQQKARLAVDLITRDIRMMGLDPTTSLTTSFFTIDGCGHGISTGAGNDHIFINIDLDYDGLLDSDFERIGYWYDNTNNNIMMTFWESGGWVCEVLVNDVTNFQIGYLNANRTVISSIPADGAGIAFVTIDITVREKKAGEGSTVDDVYVERTYSDTVRIRNPR